MITPSMNTAVAVIMSLAVSFVGANAAFAADRWYCSMIAVLGAGQGSTEAEARQAMLNICVVQRQDEADHGAGTLLPCRTEDVECGIIRDAAAVMAEAIRSSYMEVFGRPPTATELAGWIQQLQRKSSWSAVALNHWMMDWLVSPAGDLERQQVITRAYKVNGRIPTNDDLAYWTNEMRRRPDGNDAENHTYVLVVKYIAKANVVQAQIVSAYREAYGRDPDTAELAGWMKDIGSRTKGVAQQALVHWLMNWLRSPAGANEEGQVISRAYRQALLREPTAKDIEYWIAETMNKRPSNDDDKEAHTYVRLVSYLRESPEGRTASIPVASNEMRPPIPIVERRMMIALISDKRVCVSGYVWREATPKDYACVTPQRRAETARDNKLAMSRRQASDSDACSKGFVWRDALAGDHVCVLPETRSQAAEDNLRSPEHKASN